jgi:NAD(P)-dependent dehydrogenase (short-subunit alcohol dehydrogenase family)
MTVLITGGCGAVGRACAETFLEGQARVFLTDCVAPDPLLITHPNVFFHAADVTDPQDVAAAYAVGLKKFGRIDAAVLAAGIEGVVGPVEEMSEQDIDAILAVNVKGCLFWMQHCLRGMKAQGAGSIVALSSISGVVGSALLAGYTMSKHAVIGLVRAAAIEAGPRGVRVNAVCPGPIDSQMMRRLDKAFREHNPARFDGQSHAALSIPLQRYATAREVAQMVAFLCSEEAAFCHGGVHMLDGGFTAR